MGSYGLCQLFYHAQIDCGSIARFRGSPVAWHLSLSTRFETEGSSVAV